MGKNLLLADQFQGFLEEIPKGPNLSYFGGIGQGPTKLNEEIVSQENVELLSKVRPVLLLFFDLKSKDQQNYKKAFCVFSLVSV